MQHNDHSMMNTSTPPMMMMMTGNDSMTHGHHHMTTQDPHSGHGGHEGHGTTPMDHSGHGMGGMNHSGMGHMMQMFFHTGVTEYILFESLHTSNVGGLVGACVAMVFLSVLYEGLKFFREYLLRRASLDFTSRSEHYTPSTANGGVVAKQPEVGSRMLSGSHGLQTLLHMVQVFISYCLMLVFMTYNVYLCLSIIIGAGLGYFLFGWRRAMVVDMNEHCH